MDDRTAFRQREAQGARWANMVAMGVIEMLDSHDLSRGLDIVNMVFDDMWEESGGDREGLADAFRRVAFCFGLALDAAHEALGYRTVEEKRAAIQRLAAINERIANKLADGGLDE